MEAAQVKMMPSELVDKYFVPHCSDDDRLQVCTLCYPDWETDSEVRVKPLKKGAKGHTWATQHLKGKHPNHNDKRYQSRPYWFLGRQTNKALKHN